jgi:hypothetical protein
VVDWLGPDCSSRVRVAKEGQHTTTVVGPGSASTHTKGVFRQARLSSQVSRSIHVSVRLTLATQDQHLRRQRNKPSNSELCSVERRQTNNRTNTNAKVTGAQVMQLRYQDCAPGQASRCAPIMLSSHPPESTKYPKSKSTESRHRVRAVSTNRPRNTRRGLEACRVR